MALALDELATRLQARLPPAQGSRAAASTAAGAPAGPPAASPSAAAASACTPKASKTAGKGGGPSSGAGTGSGLGAGNAFGTAAGSPMVSNGNSASGQGAGETPEDKLVMYVIVRKDLDWPVGALMNQACHAALAVGWAARNDEEAGRFFSQVECQMTQHTMGANDLKHFEKIIEKLEKNKIRYEVWKEEPEDIPTALATWPGRRSALRKVFNGVPRF